MIHVGDKVRIVDLGKVYDTYSGFLDYYLDTGGSSMVESVCGQYKLNRSPTLGEAQRNVYTVMFIREHGDSDYGKLAVINDGDKTFIIDVKGLTLVSSDLPFVEGDKVYITDPMRVYPTWDNLIRHMSTVIPDGEEVYRKWPNGCSPADSEVNGKSPEAVFTVKWTGHHISRPNEDILAIISNNIHTYIISTQGLARAGESYWDKYVIYVRNWAVVNKETAQSVRDATGPKSYTEWRSGRK